jgi:hypothetical protein
MERPNLNIRDGGAGADFTNPVIFADVPDPDVVFDGRYYYMVSTTMYFAPSVPIMRSSDLVHWSIAGYTAAILDDADALALRNGQDAYGQGSWAASIRFHDGTYYVSVGSLTTQQTYVYSTPNIERGPWSRSVLDGYAHDQSLLFDGDDVWLVYGGGSIDLRRLRRHDDGTLAWDGPATRSTSPSSRDAIHDTLFAAAYIVRAFLKGAPLADSISYWTFTDVFEEGGGGIGPFHGGFGFVNENGLHKPTFHAMAMLHRLGDRLLAELPDGAITRSSATGDVSAIFYNYPAEMGTTGLASRNGYAETRALAEMGPERRVRHRVEGLRPGTELTVEILDWEHGNVAEAWYQMGAPLNITREQTAELRHVADGLHRSTLTVGDDGVLDIDLTLPAWAVASVAPTLPGGQRPDRGATSQAG